MPLRCQGLASRVIGGARDANAPACDVVVPSLPGYGFSSPRREQAVRRLAALEAPELLIDDVRAFFASLGP